MELRLKMRYRFKVKRRSAAYQRGLCGRVSPSSELMTIRMDRKRGDRGAGFFECTVRSVEPNRNRQDRRRARQHKVDGMIVVNIERAEVEAGLKRNIRYQFYSILQPRKMDVDFDRR